MLLEERVTLRARLGGERVEVESSRAPWRRWARSARPAGARARRAEGRLELRLLGDDRVARDAGELEDAHQRDLAPGPPRLRRVGERLLQPVCLCAEHLDLGVERLVGLRAFALELARDLVQVSQALLNGLRDGVHRLHAFGELSLRPRGRLFDLRGRDLRDGRLARLHGLARDVGDLRAQRLLHLLLLLALDREERPGLRELGAVTAARPEHANREADREQEEGEDEEEGEDDGGHRRGQSRGRAERRPSA